jgi:rare lipoprotein A (peptidoglycan hydrolase)
MKKISVVCIFFLGFGGLLWSQSDEYSPAMADESDISASSASIAPTMASNFRQEGVASWYGAEFAGRATASGEIFDPAQLTAAHAELPFGTYLIVTNTENGKKIAVRVNDRGPFVRSRILDVSRAAAERLDMLSAGTAKVVIEATTRESAQSLVRELGVSTPAAARTTPPASSAPQTAAPRTATTPSGSNTTPSAAQPPAASSPAQTAAPRTASTPSGSTAPGAAQPPAASTSAQAATPPSAATGTPVMSPTAPRTPTQPTVAPALVPSPSVSRVTGQVENIPEIRRSTDPGYVVVDEQVAPVSPPVYAPPAVATPQTTAPAAAPPVPTTTPVTPGAATTPAPTTPRTASNNATPQTAPASQLNATPRTATPAVTPVTAAPQSTVPPQPNPAAAVPVTNPQSADKVEFTGSQMVQGKNYRVQVGSFTELKNASDVFLRLFDAGLSPSYEHYEDKYYRVVITNVKAEDADNLSRKLAEIGITEALAREDTGR